MKTPTPKSILQHPKPPKEKKEENEVIARARIDPEDIVIIRTTYPMVVLRVEIKLKCRSINKPPSEDRSK